MSEPIDPEEDIFSDAYVSARRQRYTSADQILAELQTEDQAKRAKRHRKYTRKPTKEGPESKVKARCREFLEKQLSALVLRTNAGSIQDQDGNTVYLGETGQSDLHAIVPIQLSELGLPFIFGVFFAIECKAEGNTATENQLRYLERVRKRGGVAVVAYTPLDIEAAYSAKRAEMIEAIRRKS